MDGKQGQHFPLRRFVRHLRTVFPETNNMKCTKDRRGWYCTLCPATGQDTTNGQVYHKQNVSKHFRSEDHCARVAANQSTTAAVEEAVMFIREGRVTTSEVVHAILDDAVISLA